MFFGRKYDNRNLPVIFFTGGMFRQNDGFEFLFRRKLDLSDAFSFNDILDTLDFIGEINGCKLPIIIDGLNESAPNEGRWKEDLPILRRKIKERSNLLLITTCREKGFCVIPSKINMQNDKYQ